MMLIGRLIPSDPVGPALFQPNEYDTRNPVGIMHFQSARRYSCLATFCNVYDTTRYRAKAHGFATFLILFYYDTKYQIIVSIDILRGR